MWLRGHPCYGPKTTSIMTGRFGTQTHPSDFLNILHDIFFIHCTLVTNQVWNFFIKKDLISCWSITCNTVWDPVLFWIRSYTDALFHEQKLIWELWLQLGILIINFHSCGEQLFSMISGISSWRASLTERSSSFPFSKNWIRTLQMKTWKQHY